MVAVSAGVSFLFRPSVDFSRDALLRPLRESEACRLTNKPDVHSGHMMLQLQVHFMFLKKLCSLAELFKILPAGGSSCLVNLSLRAECVMIIMTMMIMLSLQDLHTIYSHLYHMDVLSHLREHQLRSVDVLCVFVSRRGSGAGVALFLSKVSKCVMSLNLSLMPFSAPCARRPGSRGTRPTTSSSSEFPPLTSLTPAAPHCTVTVKLLHFLNHCCCHRIV